MSATSSVTHTPESHSEGPSPTKDLLSAVSSALDKRAGKDIFAIGGSVDADNNASDPASAKSKLTIRWDNKNRDHHHTLKLPISDDTSNPDSFTSLLMDCEPATFGFGKQEVLDEEYRKAGKMDTDEFCTNFNPYEHGIIDTINQVLAQSSCSDARGLGVKAELYKLNVYSAPSGKFKPHVDTPRSDRQMGSLVVCLPIKHKGGQLAVRHGGREIVFDWASQSSDTIQWAAFFSDCEHEVFEVTERHRMTLTYNLFWTSYGPASMSDHLQALDQEALHFYTALGNLLGNEEFLEEGGLIGFTCTHAYPHTSKSSVDNLHHMLKGLDMVVYQALKRMLSTVVVTVALDDSKYRQERRECRESEREDKKGYLEYLRVNDPDLAKTHEVPSDDESDSEGFACISSAPRPAIVFDEEDYHYERGILNPAIVRSPGGGLGNERYFRMKVTWLNYSPGSKASKELSVAFVTYGNEPGIDAYYTSAVIIAKVKESSPVYNSATSGSETDEDGV
ncbi:hypothetical protein FSARC_8357 [Fusarium sarcochroum]|uniref:Fe2OG dioxygenase domain-containing protein n=1 Tax=Fusarium sarcochroum TaxID=1208366 RepID=A0A8H4TTA2_9HYPO|nr:hypothetical protein FSARC_8357 [Fusarium sarcochroum]